MKKNTKIVLTVIVLITLVVLILLFFLGNDSKTDISKEKVVIKFEFYDDFIPGANYSVEIDNDTKVLKIHEAHFCSALDCDTTYIDNEIVLTDEEYELIVKVWKKIENKDDVKSYFVGALSRIASGDNVMYDDSDSFYEESYDLNNDGIVTDREFGNVYLKNIYEEF